MTLALSKLVGSGKRITLHNQVSAVELASAPGVDVSVWRRKDGFGPRDAIITLINNGTADLVIPTPILLVSDGTNVTSTGLLLPTSPLTLGPGDRASFPAPRDSLAVGHLWRVYAVPTSADAISLSVEAEALQVEE